MKRTLVLGIAGGVLAAALVAAPALKGGEERIESSPVAREKEEAGEERVRELDDKLSKAKASADSAVGGGRFDEAEAVLLDFLNDVQEDPWKTRAEKALKTLETKAEEALSTQRIQVDGLASRGDPVKAHEMLMEAVAKTTARLKKSLAGDLKKLEQRRREAEEKRAKLEKLLVETRREALAHMEKGKLTEVVKAYEKLRADARLADARSLLTKELAAFRKLQAVVDAAETEAASRVGKQITAHGITGTIAGAGGGNIRIASGEAELVRPILKLDLKTLLGLTGLKADGSTDPTGTAMLYLWRGDMDRASRILEQQLQEGKDISVLSWLLADVDRRSAESKAARLSESLKTLVAEKKWTEAHAALTALKEDCYGTRAYVEAETYLDSIAARVEEEALKKENEAGGTPSADGPSGKGFDDLHPIPGMVGKIRRIPGLNGFQAEYRFDGDDDLKDWEGKGPVSDKWTVKDGALVGTEGSITHKLPFVDNILIEAKVQSTSRFALQVGEYRFDWYPQGSGGTSVHATSQGTDLPGGSNYLYRMPPGTLLMRWTIKKNIIMWYCWGNKAIIKAKDWGTPKKDRTITLGLSSYSGTGGKTSRTPPTDDAGDPPHVRFEEITIRGSVDGEWLRATLRSAIEK